MFFEIHSIYHVPILGSSSFPENPRPRLKPVLLRSILFSLLVRSIKLVLSLMASYSFTTNLLIWTTLSIKTMTTSEHVKNDPHKVLNVLSLWNVRLIGSPNRSSLRSLSSKFREFLALSIVFFFVLFCVDVYGTWETGFSPSSRSSLMLIQALMESYRGDPSDSVLLQPTYTIPGGNNNCVPTPVDLLACK